MQRKAVLALLVDGARADVIARMASAQELDRPRARVAAQAGHYFLRHRPTGRRPAKLVSETK